MSSRLGSQSEAQLAKVARGGAVNLVGAIVSAIGNFALVVIVANNTSEEVAGTLFSVVSIFMILTAVSALGTDTGLARFMLRFEALGRHRDALVALRVAAVPVATVAAVLTLGVLVLARQLAPVLGLDPDAGASMLRIAMLAIPFAVTSDFALATTRAFGRMRPTATIDSILRVSLQVVFVYAAAKFASNRAVLGGAWVWPYVISSVLAVAVAVRIVRSRRTISTDGRTTPTDRGTIRSEFWLYTWPRGIARVCQIAIQRLDIVLIAALIGASRAAVYTAATRFVVLGQFVVMAIQQVLQPRFSQLIAKDDLVTVRDVFKVSTSWCVTLAWPVYLIAASAAPLYLSIFGSGYDDGGGTAVVVIMSLAMMFAIAAGPLDTLLLMAGGSTASLINTLTALAVSVGGCFVLIPRIGIAGAAVAWAMAVVVRNLMAFVQVYRLLQLTPWSAGAALVCGMSIACFAIPLLFVQAVVDLTVATFLPTVFFGAAIYAAGLWLSRDALALRALTSLVRRRSAA